MTQSMFVALLVVAFLPVVQGRDCNFQCTDSYQQVCGTDGNTYRNRCELSRVNCKLPYEKRIPVEHKGRCEETTTAPVIRNQTQTPRRDCPLGCPRIFDPVCGCDGTTYSNACVLRTTNCVRSPEQQVIIVRNGTCDTTTTTPTYTAAVPEPRPEECSLVCPAIYAPVCGSDGRTYGNGCELRVRNCLASDYDQVKIVSNGPCGSTTATAPTYPPTEPSTTPEQCTLQCPLNLDPVCGSDGSTYSNPCMLRADNCVKSPYEQVVLVSYGACDPTTSTTSSTYRATVPVYRPGECPLGCTKQYDPVCGSDGNTYGNACELRVRNCLASPNDQIQIVRNGTCHTSPTPPTKLPETTEPPLVCPLACPRIYDPVCGSDGRTYGNPCVLRAENCVKSPFEQVIIDIVGECPATTTSLPPVYTPTRASHTSGTCSLFCLKIGDPVCGSDGQTYGNPCELRVSNCRSSPSQQVKIVARGTCESLTTRYPSTQPVPPSEECPLLCTLELAPVCGSDGRTYGNACALRTSNCVKSPYEQVVLVSNGTCYNSPAYTTVPDPKPVECSLICFHIFDPVCGSDGTTYSNACSLKVRNCLGSAYDQVRIVSNGTCESSTTVYTDTTTTQPIPPPEECPLVCTLELAPVCGSDGRTYGNACALRSSNCVKSPYEQVVLVSNGTCYTTPAYTTVPDPKPVECSLICLDIFDPVCGSDGTTYGNACYLRVRNCLGSAYDQVRIVSNGTCESSTTAYTDTTTAEPRPCPDCQDTFEPVCGSDGVTYLNRCLLLSVNCQRPLNDQIQVVKEGPCETTTTPTPYP